MCEERTQHILRAQAWERAKGELNAMRHTFYGEREGHQYDEFKKVLKAFIKSVEDNDLQE